MDLSVLGLSLKRNPTQEPTFDSTITVAVTGGIQEVLGEVLGEADQWDNEGMLLGLFG